MKVTCPSCGHGSQIDAAKIPEKGVQTKCRKCNTRFLLTRKGAVAAPKAKAPAGKAGTPSPPSGAPIEPAVSKSAPPADAAPSDTEMYTCEKCRHKQHPSRACVYCGNPFPQFQEPAPKPPGTEPAAEPAKEKDGPRDPAAASGRKEPERPLPKPSLFPTAIGGGEAAEPGIIPCPYCDEPIREKAKKCKHCGEFLERQKRAAVGSPVHIGDVFTGLVDFRFSRMITPELVKALYIITLALGGLGALILVVFALRWGAYGAAAGALVGYLLAVIFTRVYSELSIIVFKIEENTRRGRR